MTMPSRKKLFETVLTVILIATITLAAVMWIAPQFGWQFGKVASGSMEPSISVGSVVIAKSIDTATLEVGDVIVFSKTEKHQIVHRISGIGPQGFRTKGDANEDTDPFIVPPEAVSGKVMYDIPYLGYLADSLKSTWGFVLLLVIPGLAVISKEIHNIWKTTKEMSSSNVVEPVRSRTSAPRQKPVQLQPETNSYSYRSLKAKPYEKRPLPKYESASSSPLKKPSRWRFFKGRSGKERLNPERSRSLKDMLPPLGKKG